jgi:glycosyltransferase involved in cell wall biosynthesis
MTVVLATDVKRKFINRVKYLPMLEALGRRFQIVGIHDASLRGVPRLWNALRCFHPGVKRWKQRFYMNVPAFEGASRRARDLIRRDVALGRKPDLVLQMGVLFDSCGGGTSLPHVIYADHTAELAARKPEFGRKASDEEQHAKWIELENRAYHSATHIFAFSSRVRDSLIDTYSVPPERVTVVGGGANVVPLPDVAGLQRRGDTVLFVGNEFQRKGGDVLLRAFQLVRQRVPLARLLLVTRDRIPPHLPLEGVQVIYSRNDRELILDLFRRADVFALPSRLETWGDVLLEAMAFCLPCVGTDGNSMEEIIVDGQTGFVVAQESPDALAGAIVKLLTDAGCRTTFGAAGRARVASGFTWDHVAARIARAVGSMARTGGSGITRDGTG